MNGIILAGGSGTRPQCSVLVVNYNGGDLVAACVTAVLASSISVEVLVWDNASADGSAGALADTFAAEPRVGLTRHTDNIGFAAAVNRLIPKAAGQFLLLLNPDCLVGPDTIARVMAEMDKVPEAGMAGCLIRNPDGSEQAGCRRQVPTPWRSLVRVLHLDKVFPGHKKFQGISLNTTCLPKHPVPVEAVSGAFMLVKRQALADVGNLDEQYFMHCEDLDWCMRFGQKGWQILFVPDAVALHHQGRCSTSRPVFVELHKHKGMLLFYRKFFMHQYPGVLMWVVTGSVWMRFALVAARHWAKAKLRHADKA